MAVIINAASPKHHAQMEVMADILNLRSIVYEDLGNGENYTCEAQDGRKVELRVRGNKWDGGFLSVGKL